MFHENRAHTILILLQASPALIPVNNQITTSGNTESDINTDGGFLLS